MGPRRARYLRKARTCLVYASAEDYGLNPWQGKSWFESSG